MKKLLGIIFLGLLLCSNVNALPSWIGDKPIKICKANQDVKVSMNWYKDNGKLDGDPVYTSIKKGDYLGYFKRVKGSDKNKKERYWVKSNGFFISKNSKWKKTVVDEKYKGVKINKVLKNCKKIKYLDYNSKTPQSFNEIFQNNHKSKDVKLYGQLYLPKKKGVFPVLYIQHGTGHPKGYVNAYHKIIEEMHKENIAVFIGDSYSGRNMKKDFWKLGLSARVYDGLSVLNTLSAHKNIDKNKIGITGYSYGGMVAFFTAYPKLLDLVTDGKQFAAYMPVYPGCDLVFNDPKIVNKPMLMLHAEFDDYAPTIDCINYVKKLKENQNDVKLKIYKGAHHGFIKVQDRQYFEFIGNMKNCKPGYVDKDGYWFYNNKAWKNMTELETVNAIFKECGGQGVTVWGTQDQQKRAIEDTVNFFKTHLN